jgi:hypothetical protein
MSTRTISGLFRLFSLVILIIPFRVVIAQPPQYAYQLPYQHKYNSGQTIQPIYQGWTANEDGTFNLRFGYLNRNYSEELHIPIGADNEFDMAGLDIIQNQPTYFYPRVNRDVFAVTVPADFGDREIVWSLTTQGRTLEAVGWLQPEWEYEDKALTRPDSDEMTNDTVKPPNDAPTISVVGAASVKLPAKLTLTASATDDGKPVAPPPKAPTVNEWDRTALLTRPDGAVQMPTNVPQLNTNVRGTQLTPLPPQYKLTVSYIVWRGPADISTEPMFSEVVNGSATTEITFTEPGEYQLRAQASDGDKVADAFFTVNVQ